MRTDNANRSKDFIRKKDNISHLTVHTLTETFRVNRRNQVLHLPLVIKVKRQPRTLEENVKDDSSCMSYNGN